MKCYDVIAISTILIIWAFAKVTFGCALAFEVLLMLNPNKSV